MSYYFNRDEVFLVPISKCYEYGYNNLAGNGSLNELSMSICEFGFIEPMIARCTEQGYQIIIGRRRFRAALVRGVDEVPIVVKEIEDDEIELLIVESKLTQHGMDDYTHSEIASMISSYHAKLKSQGRRTDLLRKISNSERELDDASINKIQCLNSAEESGVKFKISSRTISRYLRINLLCEDLKRCLDEGLISIRTGVELSYLSSWYQEVIAVRISEGLSVSYENSTTLRELHNNEQLNNKAILHVLGSVDRENGVTYVNVAKIIRKYSLCSLSKQDIEELLDNALMLYFKSVKGDSFKVSWNNT